MNMMDKLMVHIKKVGNPLCVELDGNIKIIPSEYIEMHSKSNPSKPWKFLRSAPNIILSFNRDVIDIISDIVGVVSIPMVNYLTWGEEGISAYVQTLSYTKEKGLIVIADFNVSDIRTRMNEYMNMTIGKLSINGVDFTPEYESDFVTFNASSGFLEYRSVFWNVVQYERGAFATIMPPIESDLTDINAMMIRGGDNVMRPFYMEMARQIHKMNCMQMHMGERGMFSVGLLLNMWTQSVTDKQAVCMNLRKDYPSTFLFIMYNHHEKMRDIIMSSIPAFTPEKSSALIGINTASLCSAMNMEYIGCSWDHAIKEFLQDGIELFHKFI